MFSRPQVRRLELNQSRTRGARARRGLDPNTHKARYNDNKVRDDMVKSKSHLILLPIMWNPACLQATCARARPLLSGIPWTTTASQGLGRKRRGPNSMNTSAWHGVMLQLARTTLHVSFLQARGEHTRRSTMACIHILHCRRKGRKCRFRLQQHRAG